MFVRPVNGICLLIASATLLSAQQSKPPHAPLVFDGNRVFSQQQLMGETVKCLERDSQSKNAYNSEALDYCLRLLTSFFRANGYLQAMVERSTHNPSTDEQIIVKVDEGALYRLGEIEIKGSKLFSPSQIRAMLPLKIGDIADGESIGTWLFQTVGKVYADLGYIRYVSEAQPSFHLEADAMSGVVDIIVEVEEGKPFTIGSIEFDGNGNISLSQLSHNMLVRRNEPFNRRLFEESLKLIGTNYDYEMINSDKDVDYKVNDETARVDLTIHLKLKATKSQTTQ